jgi:hypothetical protein
VEVEQIFACLLKEMKDKMMGKIQTNQEKAGTNRGEMLAKRDTN